MTKSTRLRAFGSSVASCALVLLAADIAFARVGVTSVTDGDPIGKPPSEQERVLRVGIDVQANELITTKANDRAHLVFLDGSSLTVGPNAKLVIDKFVYDPATKTGELAVNASKGVLRFVGGKISKTNPIVVTTPSATLGIRGGIAIIEAQPSQTTGTFLFGQSLTVSGQGQTQTATRPGSQVKTMLGQPPGQPTLLPRGTIGGVLGQLEGSGRTTTNAATPATAGSADAGAQAFSAQNFNPPSTSVPQATVLVNTNQVTNTVYQTSTDYSTATTTSTTSDVTSSTSDSTSCHACKRQDIFHGHRGR